MSSGTLLEVMPGESRFYNLHEMVLSCTLHSTHLQLNSALLGQVHHEVRHARTCIEKGIFLLEYSRLRPGSFFGDHEWYSSRACEPGNEVARASRLFSYICGNLRKTDGVVPGEGSIVLRGISSRSVQASGVCQ